MRSEARRKWFLGKGHEISQLPELQILPPSQSILHSPWSLSYFGVTKASISSTGSNAGSGIHPVEMRESAAGTRRDKSGTIGRTPGKAHKRSRGVGGSMGQDSAA